jgi:predicted N-acetyltransferase YhbS
VPEIAYRPTALDDAAEIHALLLRLAPEIPILVDTLEREEALYARIRNCARSGESWVALDESQRIVGVVLAAPTQTGRHYGEHEVLEIYYLGVAPECRRQGVFAGLVAKVLARMVPVTTTVPPHNRFAMAGRLAALGFRRDGPAGGEQRLRREPGTPAEPQER